MKEEYGPWQTIEVLITVKAYPNPSRSQSEAACIVGVRRDGGFVRLYPVPFRSLEDEQQFKKYQWIRVRVQGSRKTILGQRHFVPTLSQSKYLRTYCRRKTSGKPVKNG